MKRITDGWMNGWVDTCCSYTWCCCCCCCLYPYSCHIEIAICSIATWIGSPSLVIVCTNARAHHGFSWSSTWNRYRTIKNPIRSTSERCLHTCHTKCVRTFDIRTLYMMPNFGCFGTKFRTYDRIFVLLSPSHVASCIHRWCCSGVSLCFKLILGDRISP